MLRGGDVGLEIALGSEKAGAMGGNALNGTEVSVEGR